MPFASSVCVSSGFFCGRKPSPNIAVLAFIFLSKPKRLSRYCSTAYDVGTVLLSIGDIPLSPVNLLIVSPSLNPSPSSPEILICAANLTVPVPWSTSKNLPTLKNPSSSVDITNTRPLPFSQT